MSVVNALGMCKRSFRRTTIHDDDRVWVETGLKDVGDQALMRGLATPFPIMRPGLFLSYSGRRSEAGHKADDKYSPAVVPPPPMREVQVRCSDLCPDRLRLPCNGPHEASQFSGNCGANHRCPFSPRDQQAISSRQPALSFPRDLSDCGWRFFQPV